jgi:Domain of unknown function (DUF5655)
MLQPMPGWTCPECQRSFGRRNQSHECVPAKSIDEYFADRPEWERPIFEEIADHLEFVGDVQVEAVDVGVFFKRARTFAELRPMRNRLRLSVLLSRRLKHPRIVRRWEGSGSRAAYFFDLREPGDVDDELRDWLTEAYLSSPE